MIFRQVSSNVPQNKRRFHVQQLAKLASFANLQAILGCFTRIAKCHDSMKIRFVDNLSFIWKFHSLNCKFDSD
jgi:hypothetical protein